MPTFEEFKKFADKCVPCLATATETLNYDGYNSYFDPESRCSWTEENFRMESSEESEGLGNLKSFFYLGHLEANQKVYPGSVRFVYKGIFTLGEGLIMLSVHERGGRVYLSEHVYYWD